MYFEFVKNQANGSSQDSQQDQNGPDANTSQFCLKLPKCLVDSQLKKLKGLLVKEEKQAVFSLDLSKEVDKVFECENKTELLANHAPQDSELKKFSEIIDKKLLSLQKKEEMRDEIEKL